MRLLLHYIEYCWLLLLVLWLDVVVVHVDGFWVVPRLSQQHPQRHRFACAATTRTSTSSNRKRSKNHNNNKSSDYKPIALKDLRQKLVAQPDTLLEAYYKTSNQGSSSSSNKKKKGGGRRTRQRVTDPQQSYRYQSHTTTSTRPKESAPWMQQKSFHTHYCDADIYHHPLLPPHILYQQHSDSGLIALYKPPGWAVIGSRPKQQQQQQQQGRRQQPQQQNILDAEEEDEEEEEEDDLWNNINEADMWDLLTPEERLEMGGWKQERSSSGKRSSPKNEPRATSTDSEKRLGRSASFADPPRPSLVAWMIEQQATTEDGHLPVIATKKRNAWKALAGATSVDDSGIVLLVPKQQAQQVDTVAVTNVTFVAAVHGLGVNHTFATLRKGRSYRGSGTADIVSLAQVTREGPVTTTQSSDLFGSGRDLRGDPATDVLDRRAPRRLLHCASMALRVPVAAAENGDDSWDTTAPPPQDVLLEVGLPDDIRILADRRHDSKFTNGSFLGRASLRDSPHTTAYREINAEGDGYPGWTVDRYDRWLVVYHDPQYPYGPLPSIHDGNTAGVYYVDKSTQSASQAPRLLEGQAAPETLVVLENGINYTVSLAPRDKHYWSTGLFLDQRPQRAWLRQHCTNTTRVLNLFCHAGAFSVAAAAANATTVNIDLNRYWLDRVRAQLPDPDRHDCIYGDCVTWVQKLQKRGEQFDIIIIDPPSSSIIVTDPSSKKKRGPRKRWSVQKDMAGLVAVAASMVRPGGLLWTTTNHQGLSVETFARLCQPPQKNGAYAFRLEKVQPMPVDFPSVGPQAVKNLVWRRVR